MIYFLLGLLCINGIACAREINPQLNAKQQLLKKLHAIGALKTGNFILKSGQSSSIYIDLRGVVSYPDILQDLADCLWPLVDQEACEVICGVPYAALPVATAISLTYKKPMIITRKEAKNYGTKKLIEGFYKQADRCTIIEDVVTTGSSILETISALEQEGLVVNDVVVCVDREQEGVEYVRSKGYRVHVLFTLSEIMDFLTTSHGNGC